MFVIGLTGGIASGKTTVTRMFEEAGIPVICADQIAHEVVAAGSPALKEIERAFGPGVIDGNGELDRPAMARLVFQDENKRKLLESIIHPGVAERTAQKTRQLEQQGFRMVVVDVPLLFEVGWEGMFDAIVVVYVSGSVQEERLIVRDGLSVEEVGHRVGAQMSIEEKKDRADYVIDNSGSLDQTLVQVQGLLERLKIDAERKNSHASDEKSERTL